MTSAAAGDHAVSTIRIGARDLAELGRLAPLVADGPNLADREGTWRGRVNSLAQIVSTVLAENEPASGDQPEGTEGSR